MKDPSSRHWAPFGEDECGEERCAEDGKKWPCKVIRRWWKSPEFRIKKLEDAVERLALSNAGLRREGNDLRDKLREVDLLTDGLMRAVGDLLKPPASLSVSRTYDEVDMTTTSSLGAAYKVPGRYSYDVEYRSLDGSTWKNKKFVEKIVEGGAPL